MSREGDGPESRNPWLDQARRRVDAEVRAAWANDQNVFLRSPVDLMTDRLAKIAAAERGELYPMTIGIQQVDRKIDSIAGGKFVVILGRPSEGKSLLLYQYARQECAAILKRTVASGKPWHEFNEYVLFVGLEEDGAEISRLVAGHPYSPIDLAAGRVSAEQLRKEAAVALDFPLFVLNEASANVWGSAFARASLSGEAIWEEVQAFYRRTGRKPSLICVDYLQLLGLEEEDQRAEVARNARACRSLAHELRIPVMLASQARRSVDSAARDGYPPIPEVGDSEWSAVAEQGCDVLMSLTRPARWPEKLQARLGGRYVPNPRNPAGEYEITEDLVLLQLLKQKGRTGRGRFMLRHDFQTNVLHPAHVVRSGGASGRNG